MRDGEDFDGMSADDAQRWSRRKLLRDLIPPVLVLIAAVTCLVLWLVYR